MPLPKLPASVDGADGVSPAPNALQSFVLAEQFATPPELAADVQRLKLVQSFERDRVALAHTLEALLQFTLRQRGGLSSKTLRHQRASDEAQRAIAIFEREVWQGEFLPKWRRIVEQVAARPLVKANRRGNNAPATSSNTEQPQPASASLSPRKAKSKDGASSAPAVDEWDTSVKGKFTPSGSRVLKQWFLDHIREPYPTDSEKHRLAREVHVSYEQVSAWFINARGRLWAKFLLGLLSGRLTQSDAVARGSDDLQAAVQAAQAAKKVDAGVAANLAALAAQHHQKTHGANGGSNGGGKYAPMPAVAQNPSSPKKAAPKKKQQSKEGGFDAKDGEEGEDTAGALHLSASPTPARSVPVRRAAQRAVALARKAAQREERSDDDDDEDEDGEFKHDSDDDDEEDDNAMAAEEDEEAEKGRPAQRKPQLEEELEDDDEAEAAEAESLAQEEPLPEQDEDGEEHQQADKKMQHAGGATAGLQSNAHPAATSLLQGTGAGGVSMHVGLLGSSSGPAPMLTSSFAFKDLSLTAAQRHASSTRSFLTVPTGANVLPDSALPLASGSNTPMNMSIGGGGGAATAVTGHMGDVHPHAAFMHLSSGATPMGTLTPGSLSPQPLQHRRLAQMVPLGSTPPRDVESVSAMLSHLLHPPLHPTSHASLPSARSHSFTPLGSSPPQHGTGFLGSSTQFGGQLVGSNLGGHAHLHQQQSVRGMAGVSGTHLASTNFASSLGASAAAMEMSTSGALLFGSASANASPAMTSQQLAFGAQSSPSLGPMLPRVSAAEMFMLSPPATSFATTVTTNFQQQQFQAAQLQRAFASSTAQMPLHATVIAHQPAAGFIGGSAVFQPQQHSSAHVSPTPLPQAQQLQQQQQARFAAFGSQGQANPHAAVVLARAL